MWRSLSPGWGAAMWGDRGSIFPQAWLFSASVSACEGVGDAPGPVLLENKSGSVGCRSWPSTVHKLSSPWYFHVCFFTSCVLDLNPLSAVLILWAVKDMATLHFWFHKTVTKTKDKYVFRYSMMYCVSYHYLSDFASKIIIILSTDIAIISSEPFVTIG